MVGLVTNRQTDRQTRVAQVYLYFYTWGGYQDWVPYHWCFLYNCLIEHVPTIFHTASVWLLTVIVSTFQRSSTLPQCGC